MPQVDSNHNEKQNIQQRFVENNRPFHDVIALLKSCYEKLSK